MCLSFYTILSPANIRIKLKTKKTILCLIEESIFPPPAARSFRPQKKIHLLSSRTAANVSSPTSKFHLLCVRKANRTESIPLWSSKCPFSRTNLAGTGSVSLFFSEIICTEAENESGWNMSKIPHSERKSTNRTKISKILKSQARRSGRARTNLLRQSPM